MNGKLLSQKDRIINRLVNQPWPYWVGGVLLGIINVIYLFLTGKPWTITFGFFRWGEYFLKLMGLNTSNWGIWNFHKNISPLQDLSTWSNLGIIAGAFIAILLAGHLKIKKIKSKKYFWLALLGGWMMGYGARVAVGCNIGGFYSAVSSFGLNGWLYLPFVIIGILLGSKIVIKLLM